MDAIKAVAVDGKVFLYTVFYLCKKKKKKSLSPGCTRIIVG